MTHPLLFMTIYGLLAIGVAVFSTLYFDLSKKYAQLERKFSICHEALAKAQQSLCKKEE